MSRSITLRLILAFLLVSVTVVALASGITYWLTIRQFRQLTIDQEVDRFAADVTFYYQTTGSWDGVLDYYQRRSATNFRFNAPPNMPMIGMRSDYPPGVPTLYWALVDNDGRVLIPAGDYQTGEILPATTLALGTPISVNDRRVGMVLVVGSPPPLGMLEQQYLTRTNLALLYAALGASAVALLLGIILARALTHPIRELTTAIRAITRGDIKQQVIINSNDELGELAAAFNQMSADLDRLLKSRRQMTADIAHDLRNPLTVIGGYIESMRDGVLKPTSERLDAIQMEVRHLERLVEDLRTLSQADAGELSLHCEDISLPLLLKQTIKSYLPLAEKQGTTMRIDSAADLPQIHADPDRLSEVLGNLITNSLRYTAQGGEITFKAWQESHAVHLVVSDNGEGISAVALPYIFDRFYRADAARGRSDEFGLGLAIAKSIVEAHGGTISAESTVGVGTTIRIILPIQR